MQEDNVAGEQETQKAGEQETQLSPEQIAAYLAANNSVLMTKEQRDSLIKNAAEQGIKEQRGQIMGDAYKSATNKLIKATGLEGDFNDARFEDVLNTFLESSKSKKGVEPTEEFKKLQDNFTELKRTSEEKYNSEIESIHSKYRQEKAESLFDIVWEGMKTNFNVYGSDIDNVKQVKKELFMSQYKFNGETFLKDGKELRNDSLDLISNQEIVSNYLAHIPLKKTVPNGSGAESASGTSNVSLGKYENLSFKQFAEATSNLPKTERDALEIAYAKSRHKKGF